MVQRGRSAPRKSATAEGHAEGHSSPAVSWCICLLWEGMIVHQDCCCVGLCRSWTLSWSRAAGMPTVKSAEMMSFPDGFLLIWTSDREMRSPCEPHLPALHLNVGLFLPVFFSTCCCFLRCVFRGCDNANTTGQVKLTIGYSVEEARLFITVHACRFPSSLYLLLPSYVSFWSTDQQLHACMPACVCVCDFTPPGLWQHARRTALTLTFPSFFSPIRRPPPRGEPPPKREISTQNSTRGKPRK